MRFLFFDHLNYSPNKHDNKEPSKDFASFKQLATTLNLQYVHSIDELTAGCCVAFVHAGTDDGLTREDWEEKANSDNNTWVVFVSKGSPEGLSLKEDFPNVLCIPKPLNFVINRIEKNNELIDLFKKSCDGNAPKLSLLMGEWPELVLSRYLIDAAKIVIDESTLKLSKLDSDSVVKEFNQYANEHGLLPITSENLNKSHLFDLLKKVAGVNVL